MHWDSLQFMYDEEPKPSLIQRIKEWFKRGK